MFSHVYVPLDNSEHSNAAMELAVRIAAASGAACTGSHVYAARMHDYRFKQMEYTLPPEYQDEAELLRQRRIHDSLITTGLQLVSDSYTDVMRYRCLEAGVPFTARALDGVNWRGIVDDVSAPGAPYDLVVMGALGMGAVRESRVGSVAARVVRRLRTDTLLVRESGPAREEDRRPILVGIDGSPQSFGGLRTALELARLLERPVEAAAVYDPYLHYAVFNSIVDVLSEKASKVFRFKEQEALHEEIIDTGLATIYESHLRVARAAAAEKGVELTTTLLDGKAFEQLLRFARERDAFMLVLGRIGVHSDEGMDLGSATEQLLALAPCHLYVSSRTHVPPLDVRADAAIHWTGEAEERLAAVPAAARGIARTAVLRWCLERGHSVVASGDVERALDELMPFQRVMRRIGEVATALDGAEVAMREEVEVEAARAVCTVCGYASSAADPVVCPVCGAEGAAFERMDAALVAAAVPLEGDAAETAFDGRRLGWTLEARSLLHELPAGYLRRRVKAIVEKTARTQRLPAITREIVEPHVLPELDGLDRGLGAHRAPVSGSEAHGPGPRLRWTAEAESRLERIPDGVVRALAREQVERIAAAVNAPAVTELHAEAGIAEARARMHRALPAAPGATAGGCPATSAAPAAGGRCPVDHDTDRGLNEVGAGMVTTLGPRVVHGSAPPECPAHPGASAR